MAFQVVSDMQVLRRRESDRNLDCNSDHKQDRKQDHRRTGERCKMKYTTENMQLSVITGQFIVKLKICICP